MANVCISFSPSVTQSASESDVSLLPKRGPEPLEYIPLGKRRCKSEEKLELQPKRFKKEGNRPSEPKDGFTYMGMLSEQAKFIQESFDISSYGAQIL